MMNQDSITRHLRYVLDILEADPEDETAIRALELGVKMLRKLKGITALEYHFQTEISKISRT